MRFFPSFFPLVAAVKGQSHYGWWMFSSSVLRRRSDFWVAHFVIKYISCLVLSLSLCLLSPSLQKLTGIAFIAWIVSDFGFYIFLQLLFAHHNHLQLISFCLSLSILDVSTNGRGLFKWRAWAIQMAGVGYSKFHSIEDNCGHIPPAEGRISIS